MVVWPNLTCVGEWPQAPVAIRPIAQNVITKRESLMLRVFGLFLRYQVEREVEREVAILGDPKVHELQR